MADTISPEVIKVFTKVLSERILHGVRYRCDPILSVVPGNRDACTLNRMKVRPGWSARRTHKL